VKTCGTATVGDQPPASQPTTKDATKHNAKLSQVGGHRCKGRPKNTTRMECEIGFEWECEIEKEKWLGK